MSYGEERAFRQEMVEVHRRLYELGFSVANDGNSSVRVDAKTILITPMGLNKAKLTPSQIVALDMEGNALGASAHPPSSEKLLHVAIYKVRPEIRAIIHAHPPFAIACSLAGVSLSDYVLPEVIVSLGRIPTVPYATPSTKEFADMAADLAKKYDALILDRHGAVSIGTSLDEAMQKLERLEHTAKIAAIARSMGTLTPLPKPEVEKLLQIAGAPKESTVSATPDVDPNLVELITREVKAALAKDS